MSYRVRYTLRDGRTGHWMRDYATREAAQQAIDQRNHSEFASYTVEKVPEVSTAAAPDASPDPTASQWPKHPMPSKPSIGVMPRRVWGEHRIRALAEAIVRRMGNEEPTIASVFDLARVHDWAAEIVELCERHDGQGVEILRARVNELEAMVEERGKAVTDAHVANHVMHRDLLFALEIGQAMREAMRHGLWGHDGEGHLASVSAGAWDRFKASLAKATSVPAGVPAGASEAPGEGGDSDRRRLEALERYLEGDTFRQIWKTTRGEIMAGTDIEGHEYAATTLAALADKLAEKEEKP